MLPEGAPRFFGNAGNDPAPVRDRLTPQSWTVPADASAAGASATPVRSTLAQCLERCAAEDVQIVVTAPADTRAFARGIGRFTERRLDPMLHARWSVAHRLFTGGEQVHDRGSWRVLAANADGRVVGAITARFFCGEVVREYMHLYSLIERTGSIFREECELAVADVFASARQHGRTATEVSPWSVASSPQAALVAATLTRAMLALGVGFELPLGVTAAHEGRSEYRRLNRLGGVPLGRGGRYYLPPFIHHMSGARLRLLVLDSARFGGRLLGAAADLAVLRTVCPIVSTA